MTDAPQTRLTALRQKVYCVVNTYITAIVTVSPLLNTVTIGEMYFIDGLHHYDNIFMWYSKIYTVKYFI